MSQMLPLTVCIGRTRRPLAMPISLVLLSESVSKPVLEADRQRAAQSALDRMLTDHGYCRNCARSCLGELLKARYADA